MSLSIDTQALTATLNATAAELRNWNLSQQTQARSDSKLYERRMQALQAEMEALTAREAELGEKRVVVEQDDEKVKDDLFTREEALKQAKAEEDSLPARVQALLDDVQRARAAHDAKDRANAERRAEVTGSMDAVSSVVDLYAQRLGFTFSGSPGAFSFIFTQVDAAAPLRAFRFTLLVPPQRGGAYALAACDPPLGDAASLRVAALTADGEKGLPRFVAAMRADFVALAARGAHAPAGS